MKMALDLVVVGTGTAASTVASRCRSAGWNVAIIDSLPFGGTCALRGCDPKKVLVGAADVIDWSRRMKGKGILAEGARIDWSDLMAFKRTFTDPTPKRREEGLKSSGVETFHGRARFVGPTTVEVGADRLEARRLVIAAGAKPVDLKIPGAELLTTSDRFLELNELPPRLVFVGGGYISFEFAHVAARVGAQATILHRGPRPLAGFDPDLVGQLVARTRKIGVDVQLEAEVKAIEETAKGLVVHAEVARAEKTIEADLVVHGAGRVPDIDDLGLDVAGVERGARGVTVNEYLQSVSNPAVYAAGDAAATGGMPLTPVAGYEGGIVAKNLLEGNHQKPDYLGVPSVVFTIPPLATVGLQEQKARELDLRFKSHREDTSSWYSSRRVGEECSGFKVLVEEGSGRVLGAHLLGPHAEETINLFALAIRRGIAATELKEMIYAYPTQASDVQYMV